jgi:hypothetical protein
MVKPVKIKLTKDQKERLSENNIVYGWLTFEKPNETILKGVEFPSKLEYFEVFGEKTPLYLVNTDKNFTEFVRKNIAELIIKYVSRDEVGNYYGSFEYYLLNLYAIYSSYLSLPYAHSVERYQFIFRGDRLILENDPLYELYKLNLEVYKNLANV